MFAPGRVIFGYLLDIRKQCNRKVAKQAVALYLSFAAVSALFVLLRALSRGVGTVGAVWEVYVWETR